MQYNLSDECMGWEESVVRDELETKSEDPLSK